MEIWVQVRHFGQDETASQKATITTKQPLEEVGLSLSDIDYLVCTRSISEPKIPCTTAWVQKQLGEEFSGIPTFDINLNPLN